MKLIGVKALSAASEHGRALWLCASPAKLRRVLRGRGLLDRVGYTKKDRNLLWAALHGGRQR